MDDELETSLRVEIGNLRTKVKALEKTLIEIIEALDTLLDEKEKAYLFYYIVNMEER